MKIEEFLQLFGQRLASLSCEAFRSQVRALIKLKECEDAHLGEEVDRHWFEVVTQQYVFTRLSKEVTHACTHTHTQQVRGLCLVLVLFIVVVLVPVLVLVQVLVKPAHHSLIGR